MKGAGSPGALVKGLTLNAVMSPLGTAPLGLPGGITSKQESSLHSNGDVKTFVFVKLQEDVLE
jgi:hypothetical protein